MKLEFVMLAHVYKPAKHLVAGWYMSEKLDGRRAYWDGGMSRGCVSAFVPYANVIKDKKPVVSTGLWTRYGKVVHAPDWWLDQLPKIPLDGELWAGRGNFQYVSRITARHIPDERWQDVQYKVFDSPINLMDRTVTVHDYKFLVNDAAAWAAERVGVTFPQPQWDFEMIQSFLKGRVTGNVAQIVEQVRLPFSSKEAVSEINAACDQLCVDGAEGLMLRKPESFWHPHRTYNLLKVVPWKVGKGTVVGYRHAEAGKIEGLMGSLILEFEGKRFKVSGFTDTERNYDNHQSCSEARQFPGTVATNQVCHDLFPKGKVVEFKYRELTDAGIPKSARFKR